MCGEITYGTASNSAALFCYDYLLTFDREVQYLWRRKFASSTVLYALMRYSTLAAFVLTSLGIGPSEAITSDAVSVTNA